MEGKICQARLKLSLEHGNRFFPAQKEVETRLYKVKGGNGKGKGTWKCIAQGSKAHCDISVSWFTGLLLFKYKFFLSGIFLVGNEVLTCQEPLWCTPHVTMKSMVLLWASHAFFLFSFFCCSPNALALYFNIWGHSNQLKKKKKIISKVKEESLLSVASLLQLFLFNSSSHTAVSESLISWTEMSDTSRIIYLLPRLAELHLQQCLSSGLVVYLIEMSVLLGGGRDGRMNTGSAVQFVPLTPPFNEGRLRMSCWRI